jgi:hypothetical protein
MRHPAHMRLFGVAAVVALAATAGAAREIVGRQADLRLQRRSTRCSRDRPTGRPGAAWA